MIDDEQSLPNDIEQLKAMLLAERKQSAQQAARLVFLEEQFRLAQQQRFGASSESHPAQGDLFNEVEAELDVIEYTVESISTAVKKKPVRQKLPKDLEREVIIHDLNDEEKICTCCGKALHQMGEYEVLKVISQKQKIYLSGNTYERDKNFPGLYFQTSFIINSSDDVVLKYRRLISMFAPTPYDVLDKYIDIYGADDLFPVVNTEIGNLSAVASEEIYPEISRILALKGAEVICHSSSEISSPLTTSKNIAKQAIAYENNLYVISANSAGISGTNLPENSADGVIQK